MIKPLIYRVLVKAEKFEEFSEDVKRAKSLGMVIPELEDHKRQQASVDRGIVVAIGETAFRDHDIECPIKIGDVVNYARFAGKIIVDPETKEEFVALNDDDLICIVKESHE